ncbi:MAG: hypothetical protein CL922_07985 [Deltaproteobacteria bacterium]|mgnify:FL=1|nr:hypothetical protein [Deltaproteobacteria bacterium]
MTLFFPLRIINGVLHRMRAVVFPAAFVCATGALVAQRGVTFTALEGENEPVQSSSVSLGGGRLATIAVVGSNPQEAALESGRALKFVGHDPVTRLTVLAGPEDDSEPASLGSALGLLPGAAVYLPGQKRASRVVRWENTFQGKVLPMALIRIHHPLQDAPLPGTPLINAEGEVVALCHEAAPGSGNGTYALPVEAVERIEFDLKNFGRVSPCWIGVTVNAVNPVLAVEMVRPDSPGAVAGLKRGDILLSVGRRRVSDYAEARNAFYYLMAGRTTNLTLLRGTRRLDLKVVPEVHPLYRMEQDRGRGNQGS